MSLNDFAILQKLGSGSFASVYKARRLIDQKIYALKKINLKALSLREKNNALNQIRLLACLKSPFIIGYCESFFDEKLDILCIAMEYADGGDLYKKILSHKKNKTLMPEIQIWKIFLHLLYGLNELHEQSILHRDLKSENIFIVDQIYKIGDMNVSKIVRNGKLAQTQTGTPYYASPQVWNDNPYNDKSDIWSLGCILYEITTLSPPFQGKTMQDLFQKINKATVPRIPSNYSKQLQFFIDQCLQKNPNLRPNTKDLLSNPKINFYENMLIDKKHQVDYDKKQNKLLKTIYMPIVKRELNNKLPQSNYKSDRIFSSTKQNKQQSNQIKNSELQNDSLKKNEVEKKKIQLYKSYQLKKDSNLTEPIVSKIQDLIKKSQNNKKNYHKQIKNDSNNQSKKIRDQNQQKQSITTNKKRVNSCKILKEQYNTNYSSRKDLLSRAQIIVESQKIKNTNIPLNNICTDKKIPLKQEKQKSFVNVIQQGNVLSKSPYVKGKKQQEINIEPKKLDFDQKIERKSENQHTTKKEKTRQQNEQRNQKLFKDNENQTKEIQKSPYLACTIKNFSNISAQNHHHYDFKLKDEVIQTPFNDDQPCKKSSNKLSEAQNKQVQDSFDGEELIQNNKNTSQNEQKELRTSRKVGLIVGFEKLRSFYLKQSFKISIIFINQLKKYQSISIIQNKISSLKDTEKQIISQKVEIKRARSKSIPKLQKPRKKTIENQQLNNFLLNKISQQKEIVLHVQSKKNQAVTGLKQKKNHQSQGNQYFTECKPSRIPLMQKLSNIQNSVHKSHKKIFPESIFSNQLQSKKRRIFQQVKTSNNIVHNLNDQLDRMNLERKMKKYFNY